MFSVLTHTTSGNDLVGYILCSVLHHTVQYVLGKECAVSKFTTTKMVDMVQVFGDKYTLFTCLIFRWFISVAGVHSVQLLKMFPFCVCANIVVQPTVPNNTAVYPLNWTSPKQLATNSFHLLLSTTTNHMLSLFATYSNRSFK